MLDQVRVVLVVNWSIIRLLTLDSTTSYCRQPRCYVRQATFQGENPRGQSKSSNAWRAFIQKPNRTWSSPEQKRSSSSSRGFFKARHSQALRVCGVYCNM